MPENRKPKIWIIFICAIFIVGTIIFTLANRLGDDEYVENEHLKLAYNGFVDGVEFGINDPGKNIVEKWGDPIEVDYLYGGLYMKYEDIVFYTNGHIDEDKTYFYGDIEAIETYDGYGIKKGMDIDEVQEILGKPDGLIIYDEMRQSVEGDVDPKMDYYTGDYTVSIVYDNNTKLVKYIQLDGYRWVPDITTKGFLELTDIEKEAYENYIVDFHDRELSGLSPLSIMKLSLHASQERNYEAQWELYTKEENQVLWDKEYHMEIPREDRVRNFDLFENPINIEIAYRNDYTEAYVTWEDEYNDEYDGDGNPFYSFYRLEKSKEGIWKVGFLPIQ